ADVARLGPPLTARRERQDEDALTLAPTPPPLQGKNGWRFLLTGAGWRQRMLPGAGGEPRLPCCGVPPWLNLPARACPGPLFFVPAQPRPRSRLRQREFGSVAAVAPAR